MRVDPLRRRQRQRDPVAGFLGTHHRLDAMRLRTAFVVQAGIRRARVEPAAGAIEHGDTGTGTTDFDAHRGGLDNDGIAGQIDGDRPMPILKNRGLEQPVLGR